MMTIVLVPVKARIIDNDGGFTEYMVSITINNVAPVVNAGPDDTAFPNVPVDHEISFTDPGTDAPWTVNVDWDGDLVFDETFNVPSKTFNLQDYSTFTYGPGDIGSTFTVTVEVDDNDGGVDSDSFDLEIVEDTLQVIAFTPNASGFDVSVQSRYRSALTEPIRRFQCESSTRCLGRRRHARW